VADRTYSQGWRLTVGVSLILCLVIAATYATARGSSFFQTIEGWTLNSRFQLRGARPSSDTVIIVAIDDRSLSLMGSWPPPRSLLADAVTRLQADGARVIAFDLLFAESRMEEGERDPGEYGFARAVRLAGNVVLAFAFLFDPAHADHHESADAIAEEGYLPTKIPAGSRPTGWPVPTAVLAPDRELREGAHLGHVNIFLDPDGGLRFLNPIFGFGDSYYPALPIETARLYLGLDRGAIGAVLGEGVRFGDRLLFTDRQMRLALNYRGPSGSFRQYSLAELVEGQVPPGSFSGRVVLIGATATGLGDRFPTPYARQLPGIEYFATAVDNLLEGRFLEYSGLTAGIDILSIVALGLLVSIAALVRSTLLAVGTIGAVLVFWLVSVQLAFSEADLWLNVSFPAMAILLCIALAASRRAVLGYVQRRISQRERHNLARYHSPLLVDRIADDAQPQTERRAPMAVVFVDMRGYTGLSEALEAERVVALLRRFHSLVEEAALRNHGVINQFVGDGVMVVFGLPEPTVSDAANALNCARDLSSGIGAWNRELSDQEGLSVAFGIGLHYGPTIITHVGGQRQLHLAVTGDTVNVASRLENLTKCHGTAVLASDSLVGAVRNVGRNDLLDGFEKLPPQKIRGRQEEVIAWAWRTNAPKSVADTSSRQ
jgi:adenylate cyclase